MSKLRTILAWVIAIVAFVGIQFVAAFLGGKIGVPVSLDVDPYVVHYGRGVEDERSSITTAYGWGVNVLSTLAAIAIWHIVVRKPTTSIGRAHFFGFLLGSIILIVGGVPVWKVFANSEGLTAIVGNLFDLALVGAAIFAGMKLSNYFKKTSQT